MTYMGLTRHEKEIVARINKGEIFDIPSYLRSFGKGHDQTYDMNALRSKFTEDEGGRKYKVLKAGHSLFTSSCSTQYVMGQPIHTPLLLPRMESDITDDEWTLREAEFVESIPPSVFSYDDQEYKVDFCKGAFVADDFNDILNFIRLWSRLRRENLVFEVCRPVLQDEISMLYELTPCSPRKHAVKIIFGDDDSFAKGETVKKLRPVRDIHETVPRRRATEFMDAEWKMNDDHLMMCREFLGRKMYPTEASHNFEANKYRTTDEIHRNLNSIVAMAALLISVLSFGYGLLHTDTTYQPALDKLTQQIVAIQTVLDDASVNRPTAEEIAKIYEKLESIEESCSTAESSEIYFEIGELAQDIEEIRKMLAAMFPTTDLPN